jgi:hypothetical protein
MEEFTEAEIRITEETRELLVSLDEKQKELTEHQTNIVNIKKQALELVSLFCLILPIVAVISLINCSISLNMSDVFTSLTTFFRIDTSTQSL